MKALISAMVLLFATVVLAAGGERGAHSNEIPSVIIWQVINLSILFGVLFYLLKDKVVNSFAQRQKDYLAEAEKTRKAQMEAEKQFLDIQHKLQNLRNTEGEALTRAQAEAKEMKEKLIAEGQAMAQRIRQDAETSLSVEIQKAQMQLKNKVVADAILAAQQVLTRDIGSSDHQKLQNDFTKNIQAVNP